MDNWSAPRGVGVVLLVAGVLLGAAAVGFQAIKDPVGMVLVGIGVLALIYLGLQVLVLRPRLSADDAGVVYRGAFGRKVFPWDGLEIGRTSTRHWGRESVLLELTRGDDLLFLGRWELGEAPALVAEQLEALRPS
ncbi:PH domain-containing protein [Tsukamurella asaccharolytica]|uniref:PH domain-containing protein n=1 Tax=Tsukamurella asaccharolytica TaxID=2592067 RepID=A0A5C5R3E4_9ACTN|nr:PH domain-containing protein [Tsukamurella asaccharolytica]TWS17650.1 PH domain-containing protein [Tsukamurella asaccharolytica]